LTQVWYSNGAMKLTIMVSAYPKEPKTLLDMMRQFNATCNYLSAIAFKEKLFNWHDLQKRAYHEIRANFGLKSAQAVVAIRRVAAAYKNKSRRRSQATFRPLGSMPLIMVDPKNTSKTCPQCGFVSGSNRVVQSLFCCRACGFSGPADVIAARNIASRALGDAPYAACPHPQSISQGRRKTVSGYSCESA
jgi:predicted transposase